MCLGFNFGGHGFWQLQHFFGRRLGTTTRSVYEVTPTTGDDANGTDVSASTRGPGFLWDASLHASHHFTFPEAQRALMAWQAAFEGMTHSWRSPCVLPLRGDGWETTTTTTTNWGR